MEPRGAIESAIKKAVAMSTEMAEDGESRTVDTGVPIPGAGTLSLYIALVADSDGNRLGYDCDAWFHDDTQGDWGTDRYFGEQGELTEETNPFDTVDPTVRELERALAAAAMRALDVAGKEAPSRAARAMALGMHAWSEVTRTYVAPQTEGSDGAVVDVWFDVTDKQLEDALETARATCGHESMRTAISLGIFGRPDETIRMTSPSDLERSLALLAELADSSAGFAYGQGEPENSIRVHLLRA